MPKAGVNRGAVAPTQKTMTRRAKLSCLAAACVAVVAEPLRAAEPAAEADATLIAHLAAFDALERRVQDLGPAIEDDRLYAGLMQEASSAQAPLLEAAGATRASTFAGILARVRSMVLYEAIDIDRLAGSEYVNERLVGFLLRDLRAMACDPAPVVGRRA